MNWYYKTLLNPKNPDSLLTINMGVTTIITVIAFLYYTKILTTCTIPAFIICYATLLYLTLMRWQMIEPPNNEDNKNMKFPLTIKATILYSILTIIFWTTFPAYSIIAANEIGLDNDIGEDELSLQLIFGLTTIRSIILVLIILLVIRVVLLIRQHGDSREWGRLFFICLDVICTIVVHSTVYTIILLSEVLELLPDLL